MFPGTLHAKQNTSPEAFMDDPPDEPGAEMAREARVWKTYVRESDKSDKEMVGGQSNSLDVLLIFAALFSTISTAFVIESLGDLKPDSAESSAQTLLVISQMLAVANNQSMASPPPNTLDPPVFSPSRTAVAVNILWFLSLSLSVAVSLVAILAKEWCYKFMSGRSGPSYEQARRRQRKWNSMEKWRMKKTLIYLPAMMHLALLLFALGLCLYLWDVNKRVALPVIATTGLAILVYTCATIFPAVDNFCPYSTPAIEILADLKSLFMGVAQWISKNMNQALKAAEPFSGVVKVLVRIESSVELVAQYLHMFLLIPIEIPKYFNRVLPIWLSLILALITTLLVWGHWMVFGILIISFVLLNVFLAISHGLYRLFARLINAAIKTLVTTVRPIVKFVNLNDKLDDLYNGDARVPMDIVTSQMLAWLIANCEDSRSVDTALEAIAGASRDMPQVPLVECGIHKLVLPRLDSCIKQGGISPLAVKYCRTYGVLISGSTIGIEEDRWSRSRDGSTVKAMDIYKPLMLYLDDMSLGEQAELSPADYCALAFVAITTMPICHWKGRYTLGGSRLEKVLKIATSLIKQQMQPNANPVPASLLYALVESTSHYLIGLWPREENSRSHSLLPILLAHIFLFYHNTAPEIARSAAITLAAMEFACRSYPGGEQSARHVRGRENRAVDVLKYYQAHQPDKDAAVALFTFGFSGLLPYLDLSDPETRLAATASYLNGLMQQAPQGFDFNRTDIRTLPDSYSLANHAYLPALRTFISAANGKSSEDELRVVYTCLPLLFYCPSPHDFPKLYILALMALCRVESRQLQELCISIIDRQPIPVHLAGKLDSAHNKTLFERLCRTLIDADTPILPIAALHFELLVASIALDNDHQLQARQDALKSLLAFRGRFPELKEPSPLSLESISHSEDLSGDFTRNSMLHAMQCVVDFCGAGLNGDGVPKDGHAALERLKDGYKPGTAMILPLGAEPAGSSSGPTQAETASSKTDAPSISGGYVDADGAVWVTEEQDVGSTELKLVLRGS